LNPKGVVPPFLLEVFLHLGVVLTYLIDKLALRTGNKKLHPTETSPIALRPSLLELHSYSPKSKFPGSSLIAYDMIDEELCDIINAKVKEHFKKTVPYKEALIDVSTTAFFVKLSEKGKKQCIHESFFVKISVVSCFLMYSRCGLW
jgi:hypothetical protein